MAQERIIRVGDDGRFRRKKSEFRDVVDGEPEARFGAESGRYHLYVTWACPWAHRTLLARALYGLEAAVGVSHTHWLMDDRGAWSFQPDQGYRDELHDHADLEDVYRAADPGWPGIGTVPVLWDSKEQTIVNNESREIVRMMSTGMRSLHTTDVDLLPAGLERDVDAMIDANYETVNNGVYKAGFARTQEAYDEEVGVLFSRLDELDGHLESNRFLLGDTFTEADVCLFPTLVRFDPVYHSHFKCSRRRIVDYPNLLRYTQDVLAVPGVAHTMNLHDTRRHYFASHTSLNPTRIVPVPPRIPELGL